MMKKRKRLTRQRLKLMNNHLGVRGNYGLSLGPEARRI